MDVGISRFRDFDDGFGMDVFENHSRSILDDLALFFQTASNTLRSKNIRKIYTGWCSFYPSEKYESQLG